MCGSEWSITLPFNEMALDYVGRQLWQWRRYHICSARNIHGQPESLAEQRRRDREER